MDPAEEQLYLLRMIAAPEIRRRRNRRIAGAILFALFFPAIGAFFLLLCNLAVRWFHGESLHHLVFGR